MWCIVISRTQLFVFGEPDQPAADQGAAFPGQTILVSFQCSQDGPVPPVAIAVLATQILLDQPEPGTLFRRGDPLHRLFIDKRECGAQCLMTNHYPVQCPAQGHPIQFTLQAQPDGNVISLAHSLHLRQKP